MENQGSIRNPTNEELENYKKRNQNKNVYKQSESTSQPAQTIGGVKLKPKNSPFEPNSTPYRLITTNNVIKENLSENQEIYVRRTSAFEDAIISSFEGKTQEKILEGINQILINCTKTDFDIKHLPLSEKFPLFIYILSMSVGKKFNAAPVPGCSICTDETVVEMDIIEDFPKNYMEPNAADYPAQIQLTSYAGADITLSLEFPRIYSEGVFLKNVNAFQDHIDKILQIVTQAQGKLEDGRNISNTDIVDIVTYLNDEDKNSIRDIVNSWDQNFGVSYKSKVQNCSNPSCCMKNKTVAFDPMEIMKAFITKSVSKQKTV